MSTAKWTAYSGWTTALSTELNSLANDGLALSGAIDNSTNRYKYIDIEVYLATVDLSSTSNPAIYVWLIARTDGTNFEDGDSSTVPPRAPDAIIPLRKANSAHREPARLLLTTPDQFKILVQNKAETALAASGNTVKYNLYSEEIV